MKIKFSDGTICELIDTENELLTIRDIKRRMAEAIIAIKDAESLIKNNMKDIQIGSLVFSDESPEITLEESEDDEFESKGKKLRNNLSQFISMNLNLSKKEDVDEDISIGEFLDSKYARSFWSRKYPKEVLEKYLEGENVKKAFENYFIDPLVELLKENLIDKTSTKLAPKNLNKFINYLNNIKERNFTYSLSGATGVKNALLDSLKMIENYIYKYLHPEYSNRSGITYLPEKVKPYLSEWEVSRLSYDYGEYKDLINKIDKSTSNKEKIAYIKELKSKIAEKHKSNKNGSDK